MHPVHEETSRLVCFTSWHRSSFGMICCPVSLELYTECSCAPRLFARPDICTTMNSILRISIYITPWLSFPFSIFPSKASFALDGQNSACVSEHAGLGVGRAQQAVGVWHAAWGQSSNWRGVATRQAVIDSVIDVCVSVSISLRPRSPTVSGKQNRRLTRWKSCKERQWAQ